MSTGDIKKTMKELDFSQFEDLPKFFGELHLPAQGYGLFFHEGVYVGGFLRNWIASDLAAQGVYTGADLKEADPGSSLPPEQRYRLVVIISDVSRGLIGHDEIVCTDGGMLSNYPIDIFDRTDGLPPGAPPWA